MEYFHGHYIQGTYNVRAEVKKKQNKFLSKRHKLTEMLSLTALIKTILNASIRRGIWVPMLVTYFALAFFVSFVHSL